jgi:predicted DNA-binding transcriptional regulator YafY
MSRTDTLFQIVEIIRTRRVTTAQYLAERFHVSVRTIYRYINELSLSGIPIISEAGIGYWLHDSFDMPPLALNEEELLALSLGARMVKQSSDDFLADAAQSLLNKVQSSIPKNKRHLLDQISLFTPYSLISNDVKRVMATCRQSIDHCSKLNISYQDQKGDQSQRTVWPLALAFWGRVWTLATWCEQRQAFRAFRLDRIHSIEKTTLIFNPNPDKTLHHFIEAQAQPSKSS